MSNEQGDSVLPIGDLHLDLFRPKNPAVLKASGNAHSRSNWHTLVHHTIHFGEGICSNPLRVPMHASLPFIYIDPEA